MTTTEFIDEATKYKKDFIATDGTGHWFLYWEGDQCYEVNSIRYELDAYYQDSLVHFTQDSSWELFWNISRITSYAPCATCDKSLPVHYQDYLCSSCRT